MRFEAGFSALIGRFSPNSSSPIALAVSGGSDSMALLQLSRAWAQRERRKLIVYTVDHQLRPDAQLEAEQVAARCEAWQIPHQILTWTAPKSTQNAARIARYQLIATAMRSDGANCLLTGHTFDDVIETALIRRRRGVRDATVAGPTIAAPLPVWPEGRGCTLLRPLIFTRRVDLQATLRAHEIGWLDDPSNENETFERVRVRNFLKRHVSLNGVAERAVRQLQRARVSTDHTLAASLAQIVVRQDGLIDTGSASCSARLLTLLARVASGGVRDPRGNAVETLQCTLTEPGARRTLGGAWFQRTQTGYLIGRDPAGDNGAIQASVFDGRYVSDAAAQMCPAGMASFLVRHALPPGPAWRELISERLDHLRLCLQTPHLQMAGEVA